MPFGLGFGETVLIFLVLVLLFGPGKIPEIGGALGKGIRDFKSALSDQDEHPLYHSSSVPTLPPPDDALPWGTVEDQSDAPAAVESVPEPIAEVAVLEEPASRDIPPEEYTD